MTTAVGSDEKQKDTERSPGMVGRESSFILKVRRGQKVSMSHWEAGEATLETLAQIWARELRKDPG